MSCWVLIPVKARAACKTRLRPAMSDAARLDLARVMLRHVVTVAGSTPGIDGVALVSPERDEISDNIPVLPDPGLGLNAALQSALPALAERGADRVIVLHADLPHLTAMDVGRLATAVETHECALAPDANELGTNAMALRLPAAMPFQFGCASFNRHLAQGRAQNLDVAIIRSPTLAHDVDEPDAVPADNSLDTLLAAIERGHRPAGDAELALLENAPSVALTPLAERLTLRGHGRTVSYSRKVFIPLTQLCRDVCHYCTFAKAPRNLTSPYLTPEQAVEIARAGAAAGCKEALFTLGDQPEARYAVAREWLEKNGYASTLDYLADVAETVYRETGLLPHLNAGIMTPEQTARLRKVSVSMGLMLESSSERLCAKGGPHYGSPDKHPAMRLATLRAAGEAAVPFTTGLLIGIGETRAETLDALLKLRDLHDQYGHIQEIIIQNFRVKPGTKMADAPEPPLEEQVWAIAATRLLFGPAMSIQAPPNLQPAELTALVRAGINDWGGVSPVTPDHVNPEAPWPHLVALEAQTEAAGRQLAERLAIGPVHARNVERWVDPSLRAAVRHRADAVGLARDDDWAAGSGDVLPARAKLWIHGEDAVPSREVETLLARVRRPHFDLTEAEIAPLFAARGQDYQAICAAADELRQEVNGSTVTYVVNRNINYTNICTYKCGFCAFSKGSTKSARGAAYNLDLSEVAGRAVEAWAGGATEVCLQGGIHPSFTGDTYLSIVRAVKDAVPGMHVHAFSPLEITHGAKTLGLGLEDYLRRLKQAGLATLPGTAAEILDDEVRDIICPDKLNTGEWLEVMRAAHTVGLRSTATIMFGHVETTLHWARHLLRVRAQQVRTGGFTEFVPLPYVHMESPMWRKGHSRSGPTFREAMLMQAVARLVLHPVITNIQTSWVKLGPAGALQALQAGANDLGGVLMNESITRAAGGVNGQLLDAAQMQALALSIGRPAAQRTTLYERVNPAAPVEDSAELIYA